VSSIINLHGNPVATKAPKKQKKPGSDEGRSKASIHAFSSRVGSGRSLWFDSGTTDHRTQSARRFREIAFTVASDLGGMDSLSEVQRQLVRRHAALSLQAEKLEAALVKDEEIDVGKFTALTNTLQRVSAALGLARQVLDITPEEELKRLLEDNEVEDGKDGDKKGDGL
jgi:hypothetical protein